MVIIQFSKNNSLVSRLIRLFTWSWASHVDFVLRDEKLLGATMLDGVSIKDPESLTIKPTRIERYTVDLPHEIERIVMSKAASQVGKPYDLLGVFGILFRKNWQNQDSWFCSELVAWAFQSADCPLLNQNQSRITPRDLLMSPKLKRLED